MSEEKTRLEVSYTFPLLFGYHRDFNNGFVAAFLTKTISVGGKDLKYEIWDTAGQERYHRFVLGRRKVKISHFCLVWPLCITEMQPVL